MSKLTHWFLFAVILHCIAEKVLHYVSIERPKVLYNDSRYIANIVLKSRRIRRGNPIHYFNIESDILFYAGNNVTVSFYMYEFLTNTYKRSFVEAHYKVCDFFQSEFIIGGEIKKRLESNELCPLPPNHYRWMNITISPARVPKTFPFPKGRMFTNITWTKSKIPIACTCLDFELKPLRINSSKSDWFT